MSGIFDRLPGDDKVPVHTLTNAIVLGAAGEFTNAKILSAINDGLDTSLDSDAQNDLLNIKAELLAQSGAGGRAEYMHKLEAAASARAHSQFNNETDWRTFLNIA